MSPSQVSNHPGTTRVRVGPAIATLAGVIGLVYFYRGFFFGAMVQGDHGDGRLTQTIAAHWARPFQFSPDFRDTGIFFPFQDGLIYSDSLLVFGLLAAPLDWVGLDPSIAFQISLIAVSALGYAATVALMRLGPRGPWLIAIPTGLILTFSNGLLTASNHPQLIAISLLTAAPLLWVLSMRSRTQWQSRLAALASGAAFGLMFYSAFYVGWAASLAIITAGGFFWASCRFSPIAVQSVGLTLQRLSAALLGLLPFLFLLAYTYWPLQARGEQRSLEVVRIFALEPRDLINVSPHNLLWSPLIEQLLGPMADEEYAMAPTPILLLAALAVLVYLLVKFPGKPASADYSRWPNFSLSLLLTAAIFWVLPVNWGRFFPWEHLWFHLPGAAALRAIGRLELIAGAFMILGLGIFLSHYFRQPKKRSMTRYSLCAVLMVLLVVEQVNFRVKQEVDVSDVQAIRSISAPPEECESFFLRPPFYPPRPYDSQTDAAIIAQTHGIPTWNGGSGGEPPGWILDDMANPTKYLRSVADYREMFGLELACSVDSPRGEWIVLK